MRTLRLTLFVLVVSILSTPITSELAADVYYVQPIAALKIVEGELPNVEVGPSYNYQFWWRSQAMQTYMVLDGQGEAYVTGVDQRFARTPYVPNAVAPTIAIRTPKARRITGRLFLPKKDFSGMVAVKFSIPADQGKAENRKRFLQSKLRHYQYLMSRDIPGTAWFRHQVRLTRKDLGLQDGQTNRRRTVFFRSRGSMEDTYDLLSGGRAISENLQLDRVLPTAKAEVTTIALDSIRGVTVKEFDWKPMIKGLKPKKDPLAALIPDDQYAIFLPSFQAMTDLIDNADKQGTPVLQAAEPRATDARVRQRYERQLGLSSSQLSRLIGPLLINSIAVTGADPYLRTGADIAVLFQAKHPDALRKSVDARVSLLRQHEPQGQTHQGQDQRHCLYGIPLAGPVRLFVHRHARRNGGGNQLASPTEAARRRLQGENALTWVARRIHLFSAIDIRWATRRRRACCSSPTRQSAGGAARGGESLHPDGPGPRR